MKITHTRFHTERMISWPLTKRDKVSNTEWVSLKMHEVQLFSGLPFDQWRTMVSFRDWDHDVQKTICISTPKYFRVCKTALSIWKRGDGTRADLVRAFFPSQFCSLQEQYRSSEGFDYCNVLLSHSGLFYMWFVKEKIYLAHTLEWHTWFWQ